MKKRWIPLAVVSVLLLAIGGALFANRASLSTAVKNWRSSQLLEKAVEAKRSGDLEEAYRNALASHQLDTLKLEPLRILLDTGASQSINEHLKVANAIFFHPDALAADRAKCLSIYLTNQDFRLFAKYFEALPAAEKKDPDILYLQAGYFAAQGGADSAIAILNRGPKDETRFAMLRVSLLSISPDEAKRKNGQRALAKLIESEEPAIADHAFRLITNIPPTLRDTAILRPAANEWFEGHDEESILNPDHLIMATFEWLDAKPPKREKRSKVFRDTIAKLGSSDPVLVANWLMSLEARNRAIIFATKADAQLTSDANDREKKGALFEIRLRALRALSRWEEQLELLDSPPDGLSPLSLSLARANAANKLERGLEASKHWKEAWRHAELASARRNSYLDIYQWARQTGEPDQAVRALIEAGKSKLGMLPPTDELTDFMIFLANNERDEDLVALTDSFFWREAFSPPLINNAVYLRELAGSQVAKGDLLIQNLSESDPDSHAYDSTLILLLLKREKFDEAFLVAKKLSKEVGVDNLGSAEALLIAGAYRHVGKKHKKAESRFEAKFASLLPVEKQAFEGWFAEEEP